MPGLSEEDLSMASGLVPNSPSNGNTRCHIDLVKCNVYEILGLSNGASLVLGLKGRSGLGLVFGITRLVLGRRHDSTAERASSFQRGFCALIKARNSALAARWGLSRELILCPSVQTSPFSMRDLILIPSVLASSRLIRKCFAKVCMHSSG